MLDALYELLAIPRWKLAQLCWWLDDRTRWKDYSGETWLENLGYRLEAEWCYCTKYAEGHQPHGAIT